MTYAARLADGPTDHRQRTDRRPTLAAAGDRLAASDGRPTGDTTDAADRLAARLAAVPVTSDTASKGPATTSTSATASGKDGPKGI